MYLSLYRIGYILFITTAVWGTVPPETLMHLNAKGALILLPVEIGLKNVYINKKRKLLINKIFRDHY